MTLHRHDVSFDTDRLQRETVDYYDTHAEEYTRRTLDVDLSDLYEPFLSCIPAGGHILDAGSGSGRDTLQFLEAGYFVTPFDASAKMARVSSRITGQHTLHLQFQDIAFQETFDGVWANASLLHVPPSEIDDAISRLTRALKPSGIFFASFKYGDRDFFEDGRYFNCYTEESIKLLLARHHKLEPIRIWTNNDASREGLTWINLLYRKIDNIRP